MKEYYLNDETFDNIYCYEFKDENREEYKGIIQIVHGMQEHAGRYADMGNYFAEKGYIVFASDIKGHGKTSKSIEELGICDKDLFTEVVKDQINISKMLIDRYNLPLFIIGHSFGSFVVQRYLTECKLYEKAVLSGSRYTISGEVKMAKFLANLLSKIKGAHAKASLIEKMSLKAYGAKYKDGNWLSRDENNWKKYNEDPYSGTPFPLSFYKSMFTNMLNNYKNIDMADKNKPILILSGSNDPVSSNGKLATKLFNFYSKKGLNVHIKFYEGARHEIFNEINKYEVYGDVLSFIQS